jgi:hypothetical protein
VDPRTGLENVEKKKIFPFPDSDSDPSTFQPISSRYTDYAMPVEVFGKFEVLQLFPVFLIG